MMCMLPNVTNYRHSTHLGNTIPQSIISSVKILSIGSICNRLFDLIPISVSALKESHCKRLVMCGEINAANQMFAMSRGTYSRFDTTVKLECVNERIPFIRYYYLLAECESEGNEKNLEHIYIWLCIHIDMKAKRAQKPQRVSLCKHISLNSCYSM